MEYRILQPHEISRSLFKGFKRTQKVTHCWRKIDGQWQIQETPFVDDWTEEEYCALTVELKALAQGGGAVFGALEGDRLAGFASVAGEPVGTHGQYLDLTNLHVSQESRRKGVGRTLFQMATAYARERGIPRLYISAHSAVESQAFYRSMGCEEASEYQRSHVEREPFDCQLEYRVLPSRCAK